MIYNKFISCAFILCLSAINYKAMAVPATFHGTLIEPPPCTINQGKNIDVDFGTELLTTRIDGKNYEMAVPYTVECGPDARSNLLKIQMSGTGAGFDPNALATQKADLAIELRKSGVKMLLNSWINFTYPAMPTLTAVPIKRINSELTGGAFNATGTLQVDYQ